MIRLPGCREGPGSELFRVVATCTVVPRVGIPPDQVIGVTSIVWNTS
jgi:hypothetical protein